MTTVRAHSIGTSPTRVDGPAKLRGRAPYAMEHPQRDPLHAFAIQATIARGRVRDIDSVAAERMDGVVAVLTRHNAPRLAVDDDKELFILQDDEVAFRGQLLGAVIATSPEVAREAAALVRVTYDERPAEVTFSPDRDDLYAPEDVSGGFATDTSIGDVDAALAIAPVSIDHTYSTAMVHNNPMEPHATIAQWTAEDALVLFDSTQGPHVVRSAIGPLFGLEPEQVRVIAPYVGGGFGSKGEPHANIVLAVMAATLTDGRPVKLPLTRQQMFTLTGYRTPTSQRVRLGAHRDGTLTAIAHDVIEQVSTVKEFAEQTAISSRMMYSATNRSTTHRLATLDVPVSSWMRAPGHCPGMYAGETAIDELAVALGMDPIALRIHNEPEVDPESGRPFSSRGLVECLRTGAARFGWSQRDPTPRSRREGRWLIGSGVAAATYPADVSPGNSARVRRVGDRYEVAIDAMDIGTGTWTTLGQIAADALGVGQDRIDLRIGDSGLPAGTVAGGSSGMASWGSAVVAAANGFRDRFGSTPADGDEITVEAPEDPERDNFSTHAFGAHFVEVRVDADTAEIRVPRVVSVFAAGRIINPRTARSQFVGGITMGLGMALHEQGVVDPRVGQVVNHDLAGYHIPVNADIGEIDVSWIEEHDPHVNPLGSKGIGEIGIVGSAAAVGNAIHHATGVRVRHVPVHLEDLLGAL
ncbi:xanthine dehydrogenase family protein molybdopterin-binding subunit [Nocardia mangyaensis]|uniref:xanthine dehydrogenase family protein molybdopterin-binding subunit n=1 Tax=Nocardia mangyaensis TaxID=2213200 RepID=UPI002676728A|nr:xanthine dehydrogenase family protein molybdopterin-binding subunit [Nocardia mangyaensis]MDO3647015.1 xanthine dehydrogenase family protein molybdopterin-binding subunit [Nocardia mangyaensis]